MGSGFSSYDYAPLCQSCKINSVTERNSKKNNCWKQKCFSCKAKIKIKNLKQRFQNRNSEQKKTHIVNFKSALPFTNEMFILPKRFTGIRAKQYKQHQEYTEKLQIYIGDPKNNSSIELESDCQLYKDSNNNYHIFMKCVCCNQMQVRTPLMFQTCSEEEQQKTSRPGMEILLNVQSNPCRKCGPKYTENEYLGKLLQSYPHLSKEWAISEMNNCNNICYITGLFIKFQPRSASVNAKVNKGKKKSKESHTPENCEIIHWYANVSQKNYVENLKNGWREMAMMPKDNISNADIFLTKYSAMRVRKLIARYIKNNIRDGFIIPNYYDNFTDFKYFQIPRKKILMNKIEEQIIELLSEQQNGKCAKSGLNMSVDTGINRFSIDRIDNDFPHFTVDHQDNVSITNCRGIIRIFNTARGHFTDDQIAFALKFNRDEIILKLESDKVEIMKIEAMQWYNDLHDENSKTKMAEDNQNILKSMEYTSDDYDDNQCNIIHEQQKIISDNTKKMQQCENYTEKMDNIIQKNEILDIQNQKYNALEQQIIHKLLKDRIQIDCVDSNMSNVNIIGPKCIICKKNNVIDRCMNYNTWKKYCIFCISNHKVDEKYTFFQKTMLANISNQQYNIECLAKRKRQCL